ncbi:unannotated protein [freshwater metagenome]|uniref:Unannotated protein n=1 Tax=freshwater metagenome TaxID=449393 RepID=A0A6J7JPT7_9ZZZZ|nr:AAA domain-containing protein [Actinomycetota bacterium]MSW36926.1 AAA domain-containing protein [Actinomycetota bacterium]
MDAADASDFLTSPGHASAAPAEDSISAIYQRVAARVVGRERELELLLAAVASRRDILLEGPPGTGKTTLLRAIADEWDIPLILVEGNADLTPAKLIGHHHPARVLREGYTPENFVPGPLMVAMQSGGFFYLEEFNRAPDDTVNTLLSAMSERKLTVPRVGVVEAGPNFRVIGSMNPYDNVGTTRLSTSIHDRLCRLVIDYQDDQAERDIVGRRTNHDGRLREALMADAVAVTRATREHPDVRQGSSVRGAIDLVLVAETLANIRSVRDSEFRAGRFDSESPYPPLMLDSMIVALSGRIHIDEAVAATAEDVLREIWENHFFLAPAAASPG